MAQDWVKDEVPPTQESNNNKVIDSNKAAGVKGEKYSSYIPYVKQTGLNKQADTCHVQGRLEGDMFPAWV